MNPFFGAFAPSNAEADRVFGEPFTVDDKPWTAIDVEDISEEQRAMLGGKFRNVTTSMNVRQAVIEAAGLTDGTVVTVRGRRMRVIGFTNPGDDTRDVRLGPVQIQAPDL